MRFNAKQFSIQVHTPDSHGQAHWNPRFTPALAALYHATFLSMHTHAPSFWGKVGDRFFNRESGA
jgi:hypothetical protein